MVEGMGILHVLWLSRTLIIDSTMHGHLMYSMIGRRDIMTKWLRHNLRRSRNRRSRDRRSRDIVKAWCRWRRERRMMGTPLTMYLMIFNCMAW